MPRCLPAPWKVETLAGDYVAHDANSQRSPISTSAIGLAVETIQLGQFGLKLAPLVRNGALRTTSMPDFSGIWAHPLVSGF
jgi:hypothetical protein